MTAFYQPETIEQLFDSVPDLPTNSHANGKSGQVSESKPESLTNGHARRESEQSPSPELSMNGHSNGKIKSTQPNRELQQVVAALVGLKSELKQAGLLEKSNVQDLFLKVAEFVAVKPKPLENGLSSAAQQQFQDQRQQLMAIATRMRQAVDIEALFKVVVTAIQEDLQADRVLIYRFDSSSQGQVVAESLQRGWTPALGESLAATCFGADQSAAYVAEQIIAIADINNAKLTPHQKQLWEQFQVKSNLSLPILIAGQVWGLLAVQQCSQARQWQESDVSLLYQMTTELALNLQEAEFLNQLQRQVAQEQTTTKVIDKIRQSLDINEIFRTTTQEVRSLLKADRVAVYRFDADWSGEFIAESVGSGWTKLVGPDIKTVWEDTYLQETQGGRYRNNESFVVNDIYKMGHHHCHIDMLEQFEAKAYVIVPVFAGQKLWGLLAAYQNSGSRHWQESEVSLLNQIGVQFGVALQQAELVVHSQQQAEREKILAKIIDRIRQTLDTNTILRTTTQEVRQLLKADRVAVYRFNPDWSGEFIAESVANGWSRLVGPDIKTVWEDTHLQETQGGRYRNNQTFAVNDIYKAGHHHCHIEMLEQFEAKAYVVVPVFTGQKLWGLLAAYQNSGVRHWEELEVNLLNQVAAQMGMALQQAQSLAQLRIQSEQLAKAAAREKAAKEQLQQRVIQLLAAVKPVFSGDLTVRVPITEDEVGTIADAYNNTIQSLRKIVTQVQTATLQVAETSQSSEASIVELSQQAQQQFQKVNKALKQIQVMIGSTQAVATNAQQVETAVQQANQTVRKGDAAMNRTVDGILAIRETVAETGKKIKRLSESSQKISKVVSLISNFTTQTQLLALNASIEATRAGEYGRGFTVVADEVRSLSRQSADATTEIEKLVQEIQAETSAVAAAMDTGIQQVVGGSNLVNETRQQLNAVVAATAQISQLVQGITQATQAQTQQSQLVTQAMSDVAAIANKTSTDSSQIAASFQGLLTTAQQLQANVGQFKVN